MVIAVGGKGYEVKYTFNSFQYMEDFDIGAFEQAEQKPFKLITTAGILLNGGLNHDPKVRYKEATVNVLLNEYVKEGGQLPTLLNEMVEELQESDFFKSLQATE